jgi:hypothetical protein
MNEYMALWQAPFFLCNIYSLTLDSFHNRSSIVFKKDTLQISNVAIQLLIATLLIKFFLALT